MPTLHFKGKAAVENHHRLVPHHRLEFDRKLSELPKGTSPGLDGNLIIEGDNLLALKALLPTHAGRVKCIYIDPPYNTGNEGWVYNDNLTQPQFKEWIGKTVGKEGEDACRHDKWCCMMYPRLQLLRELLRDDGALFVSIDDVEAHRVRLLLDEVFGESNFIATVVWQKSKKGDSKLIATTHEYILGYARNKATLVKAGRWRKLKPGAEPVLRQYDEFRREFGTAHEKIADAMRAWFASLPKDDPRRAHRHYHWSDDRGLYFAGDFAGPDDGRESRPKYDIPHPATGRPCAKPSTGWRWSESRTRRALADTPPRIHFGPDETTVPCRKTYLRDVVREPLASVLYKDGRGATIELERMLGPRQIEFPKDRHVLAEILALCTGPKDVILDSFAGSGTTGHAVLALNHLDQGSRRFVLIQQPRERVEGPADLCERLTAGRVRFAIRGYTPRRRAGSKTKRKLVAGLGGSFTYARLGSPLFGEYRDFGEKHPSWDELAQYVFYTETSRQFDGAAVDRNSGRIGSVGSTSYYLLYDPDPEVERAFDLEWLKSVRAADEAREYVVYCEKVWVHREDLVAYEREQRISVRLMVVPFQMK